MSIEFIALFLIPLVLSLTVTPWVIKFAGKIGAIDKPGERKIHTTSITRLGGLAIFISICISVVASYFLFPDLFNEMEILSFQVLISGTCFLLIFMLGFIDDVKSLKTGIKFGVQFLIATLIYFAGFKISNITNPLGAGVLSFELIDFPLTILWIVGVINAFNLIDGLDGLASGIAVIACTSIFIVSIYSGYVLSAVLSLIIMGAMAGFLRYNFYPAKIFLGDSGSLLIGFCLALLSIQSTTKITTGFALFFPLLVLALPITDTLISMLRRFLGSYLSQNSGIQSKSLPKRLYGMFIPDRAHIHHQLLSLGLTHRNTVILLYMVSGFFAAGAFAYTQVNTAGMFFNISVIIGFALFAGIKKLHYHEIAIFNNGLVLSFFKKWFLNRFFVIQAADFLFIAIAYTLSYSLIHSLSPDSLESLDFAKILVLVLTVQSVVFWLTGLYQEKMDHFSIGVALHITECVGYSILVTAFVLSLTEMIEFFTLFQFLILNFYFLMTFTLGFRIAYQISIFLFNRNKKAGENILIYGAGVNGKMILHKITHSPDHSVKVLGFLDDDHNLEGKMVYGYPVLGGHWKLEKKELNGKVDSIYMCEDSMKSENMRRLRKIAYQKNIVLKKFKISLQEMENGMREIEAFSKMPGTTVSPL